MIFTVLLLQMPLAYSDAQPAPTPPPNCAPALSAEPPIPPPTRTFDSSAPYGDELGDAWEMEEAACWRGIWTRRARSNVWDAYWIHPRGERARAKLEIQNRGRDVIVSRTHPNGYSCRYEGKISGDWWEVTGTYRCSWGTADGRAVASTDHPARALRAAAVANPAADPRNTAGTTV